MGSINSATEPIYIETGMEPEFFMTHSRTEDAGNGNVRIFCYCERRRGQFILLYTVVVPAVKLAGIARRGLGASNLAFENLETAH